MNFKKQKRLFLTLLSVFIVQFAFTQNRTITGKVFDELSGEPMIGVNVTVKGTSNGVITDFDGNYVLNVSNGDILVFSFIGYKDVILKITSNVNHQNIFMSEDTQQIEEVVVVGYGKQKKASSVGAISSTKGDDLLKVGSVTTISEAMQGQIAGVTSINKSSKPGSDAASIFIRGKSAWGDVSPLVLVDGIVRDFNNVDVNEIESISVLKDASATAVYGVKGANGVILLTTKRGVNQKTKVNFSASIGFKQPTSSIDFADYPLSMKMYNEAVSNDGEWEKIIPESTIAAWENAFATGNYGPYNDYFPNVNWWDEMVKGCGIQQNYNINVSGGNEKISYFVSLGYLNDGDIFNIKKNDSFDPRFYYKRYNWRTNLDFNLSKSTTLSVNLAGNAGYRNQPGYRDGNDLYAFKDFYTSEQNAFPIKYSDGVWGSSKAGGGNVVLQMNHQGQRQYKTFQGFYDFILNQDLSMFVDGLSFKASLSYTTYSSRESNVFYGKIHGNNESQANGTLVRYYRQYDYSKPIVNEDGSISYNYEEFRLPDYDTEEDLPLGTSQDLFNGYNRKLYYELSLNYNKKFGYNNITALALFNRKINEYSVNFPSYEEDWVGRVTYNWKEKYLAELNAAYTGSEKFAPGKRFGFFPSFSVGWRVTEEKFMKKIKEKWLTNLKVRYSWGKVGSDTNSKAFNYIQTYESGGNSWFGMYDSTGYGPLYTEGKLAYADATWETAIKQNLGIDLTAFEKLQITLDLYKENRSGILMERETVAPWIGVELPSVNIGKTKNHGIDLELVWNDRVGKSFDYFVKFNFSKSENRVVFKDDPIKKDEYLKAQGKPIGYFNKYLAVGNFTSIDDVFNYSTSNINNGNQNRLIPGDLVYVDYNADGVIDNKDMVPIEHLYYPLTTYSLTFGFNYKGFGMNASLYSAADVYNEQIQELLYDFPSMIVKAQPNTLDRWTVDDINSNEVIRPSVHLTNNYNSINSTYTCTNNSYLRLKNLEFNYLMPKSIIQKLGLSKLQFYINGNNLLTIQKGDKRRDPETSSNSVYPLIKRYNIGVRMSF
ncbi:TonB-dependent receptor [Bacteroides caecigallinarum]|uniref:SusC/RagA family TonB-linked outer membrane protein n=1 Tax=Bacteroides caecigallinarum TaxID=1411144 RepID=UPI00195C5584|nr:TonB-dependent receptor [Bacteroides caecigallinarum]MBM6866611.1 TonB-dependent receptor [Bacteroides caecigallinarum]